MSLEERQKQQLRSRAVVLLRDLYRNESVPELPDLPYLLKAILTQIGDDEYEWKFQYHMKLDKVGATTSFKTDRSFNLPSERQRCAYHPKRKRQKRANPKFIDDPIYSYAVGTIRKYTTRSGRKVNMIIDSD